MHAFTNCMHTICLPKKFLSLVRLAYACRDLSSSRLVSVRRPRESLVPVRRSRRPGVCAQPSRDAGHAAARA